MKKSDFYYDLPQELIAQTPATPRDSSRLLVMDRQTGRLEHKIFHDVPDYLTADDCLILNDTKVLPARLYGIREGTLAKVEFLLLKQLTADTWEALAGPGKKARSGARFSFGDKLTAEVLEVLDNGNRIVRFFFEGNFFSVLDEVGQLPLPHYITRELEDKDRYQTVYANVLGSAAAPTAGLHFTPELLERIRQKGVRVGFVTLHVGLGTFRPVKTEDIEAHHMHTEFYSIPEETAEIIRETKACGGRVIAVGTTCCRTLESVCRQTGSVCAHSDNTDIFIYPGYEFQCIDGLLTNFHLPESTLIMLVSAFCGHENTMHAYKVAVEEKYRFFSLGDAMLIL
ncbi:MAG: tRNA preQ1(34) S-adenosylmethionine ribosyltransferase-isomerase QueA [Clostridia bacterium]|nr:tRNA preQ1(34) S-adenosylmethionine ribosyltransferase-isomerase QueA [Clostridia bacterium]